MRMPAFLLALVATFGAAVAVGGAIGPEPSEPEPTAHGEPGPHEGSVHASPAGTAPRGLAAADDGMQLELLSPEFAHGREETVRFRVVDERGDPIRAFDLAHERRMHAIVVRRDLTGFQHVHPRMDDDGTWSGSLRVDAPGSYRLYADFTRDGTPTMLAGDVRVDGAADLRPLPAPRPRTTSDGGDAVRLDAGTLRAGRDTTLRFAVTRDDRPVEIAPYLGAGGHLVALREGDLAFLHVHPVGDAHDGRVAFETTFPSAGAYRLFLQYRVGAQVRTAAFTTEVAP